MGYLQSLLKISSWSSVPCSSSTSESCLASRKYSTICSGWLHSNRPIPKRQSTVFQSFASTTLPKILHIFSPHFLITSTLPNSQATWSRSHHRAFDLESQVTLSPKVHAVPAICRSPSLVEEVRAGRSSQDPRSPCPKTLPCRNA